MTSEWGWKCGGDDLPTFYNSTTAVHLPQISSGLKVVDLVNLHPPDPCPAILFPLPTLSHLCSNKSTLLHVAAAEGSITAVGGMTPILGALGAQFCLFRLMVL